MGPIVPLVLVTVHLADAPAIPQRTVQDAQAMATRIFASARLKIVWSGPGASLHLQVMATELRGVAKDAAGFSMLTGGDSLYAAVSWPAVQRAAVQMEADPAVMLGAAMAHEIGHLLLGPEHSRSGIMSARLGFHEMNLAARGELLLDAECTKRLEGLTASRPSPLLSLKPKLAPSESGSMH